MTATPLRQDDRNSWGEWDGAGLANGVHETSCALFSPSFPLSFLLFSLRQAMRNLPFDVAAGKLYPMRTVFAVEASVFVLATLAMLAALIARIYWRWLRLSCWFVLAWVALAAWAVLPYGQQRGSGTRIEQLNAAYPTLMCIAWMSLVALTVGVTVLPLTGLWQTGESKVPNGRFWPVGRLALATVLALFALIVTIAVRDRYVRVQIERARLANKARVALLAPGPIDPDEDAGPVYSRVYRELIAKERQYAGGKNGTSTQQPPTAFMPDWLNRLEEPNFDLARPDVLAFRKRHRDCIATLVAAVKTASATLQGHELGILDELPHDSIDGFLAVSRLVELEARYRAYEGDWPSFWECLSCLDGMQHHASAQRKALCAHLARIIDHYRAALVQVIVGRPESDFGEFPYPLQNDAFTCRSPAMDAVQLEACEVLELTCANALCELDNDPRIFGREAQRALRLAWPLRQLYALYSRVFVLADGLETFDGLIERCQELGEPGHLSSKEDHEWLMRLADLPPSELADYALSMTITTHDLSISSDARRRLADLAIAIAGFQCRNGRYPQAIEELLPDFLAELPPDPWSGEPFRLLEADGGVVVYSIGPNHIDENGLGDISDPWAPDITLRVGGAYLKWQNDMEKRRTAEAGG